MSRKTKQWKKVARQAGQNRKDGEVMHLIPQSNLNKVVNYEQVKKLGARRTVEVLNIRREKKRERMIQAMTS